MLLCFFLQIEQRLPTFWLRNMNVCSAPVRPDDDFSYFTERHLLRKRALPQSILWKWEIISDMNMTDGVFSLY